MRYSIQSSLIATALFTTGALALPRPAPSVSYSVVNVDSTPTATTPPATVTINEPPSTITVTDDATPTPETQPTGTVIVPEVSGITVTTNYAEATPTSSASSSSSSVSSSSSSVSSFSSEAWEIWVPTITASPWETYPESAAATTVTDYTTEMLATPTTTSYYDDGMWHTTYPIKTWSTPFPQWTPSASKTPSSPAGTSSLPYQSGGSQPGVYKFARYYHF